MPILLLQAVFNQLQFETKNQSRAQIKPHMKIVSACEWEWICSEEACSKKSHFLSFYKLNKIYFLSFMQFFCVSSPILNLW